MVTTSAKCLWFSQSQRYHPLLITAVFILRGAGCKRPVREKRIKKNKTEKPPVGKSRPAQSARHMGIRGATNRVAGAGARSGKMAPPLTNQETPKNIMAQASSQNTGL